MNLQYIQDNNGNTTGVFIPIEDWEFLKSKYAELQLDETNSSSLLSPWQKEIIDKRLNEYYNNTSNLNEFKATLNDLKEKYDL